jgi:chorismate synthase
MLRFTTAGESHGPMLVTIVEGLPAGLRLDAEAIGGDLERRQLGHGRGRRMKIENDAAEIVSGVRAGMTTGAPVAMLIHNADWKNWRDVMDPARTVADADGKLRNRSVTRPRPGHADLAGMLKFDLADGRDVLERASARETAARVAAGAACRALLRELGIDVGSHVVNLGGIDVPVPDPLPDDIDAVADSSPVRVLDRSSEERLLARIDEAKAAGDTLGGIVEVVCRGVPAGLGSHVSWDAKLDGRLAAALMSIQAVKGVEIGAGFEGARRPGSEVHDVITRFEAAGGRDRAGGVSRATNRSGGLEGGITNGEPVVARVAMKPLSTLMRPLATIDVATGDAAEATVERSDVTALPAMGVVAEAMVAFVIAQAVLEKFGGDSMRELRHNFTGYLAAIGARIPRQGA